MEIFENILWYFMFLTPLLTVPLTMKVLKTKPIYKLLFGMAYAMALSLLLYSILLMAVMIGGLGFT